ncbi:MAG: hypothetical protein JNM84_10150 [Planctomycetes bacterium]|nr:hypothetical protein [Planctomycetota bacterium]
MQRLAPLALLLALADGAAAQCDRLLREHALPLPLSNFLVDDKAPAWVADFATLPNVLAGGSTRTNTFSLLNGAAPVSLISVARVMIASEQGTNRYFGLNYAGEWIPLQLQNPPAQTIYGQDVFGFYGDGAFHFFNVWERSWTSEPISVSVPLIQESRSSMCVVDGTDSVVGFSIMGSQAVRLNLSPDPTRAIVPVLGSGGESLTRRNLQAFEIGPNQIAFFSTYLSRWDILTTQSPVPGLSATYNKNTMILADFVNNLVHLYSAHRGDFVTLTFTDLMQVAISSQDNGIQLEDALTDTRHMFKAIDGGVASLPNALTSSTGALFLNDCAAAGKFVGAGPDEEWYALSTKVRTSNWTPAGLQSGEVVLAKKGNDSTIVLITDRAVYGFSGMSGRWTRSAYAGTYVNSGAQDFIGWVLSDTTAYVFSTREDRWVSRPMNAQTSLTDTDSLVILTESDPSSGQPISRAVYSAESRGWRVQPLSGPLFAQGRDNTHVFSIHDDAATGGSIVYFFAGLADRWLVASVPNRIDANTKLAVMEEGLVIATPAGVLSFQAFGDLSSDHSAPIDNYAYHGQGNAPVRFLAIGQPNALAVLLASLGETSLPLGFCGDLRVDPFSASFLAVPAGAYDAQGVLRLSFRIPPTPNVLLKLQMLGVSASAVQLGQLLDFQVH